MQIATPGVVVACFTGVVRPVELFSTDAECNDARANEPDKALASSKNVANCNKKASGQARAKAMFGVGPATNRPERSVQIVSFELSPQGDPVDAENPGGLCFVAARSGQDPADVLPLQIFQGGQGAVVPAGGQPLG